MPWRRMILMLLLAAGLMAQGPRFARVGEPPGGSEASAAGALARVLLPGGVRALALGALWIRADGHLEAGRFFDLLADYRTLGILDPDNESAWAFMAYQLAYSASVAQARPPDRAAWIREGIELARMGLRRLGGSSTISGQLGVIYLDRCSGDPWIRQWFEAAEGQSPLQSALESFSRARRQEEGSSRWDPYIVLTSYLLARERLGGGDYGGAGKCLEGAASLLEGMRVGDRGRFEGTGGAGWLARIKGWRLVAKGLEEAGAARARGDQAGARRARDAALDRLARLRDEEPEDVSLAEALIRRWKDR